jgi:hypothetical protein
MLLLALLLTKRIDRYDKTPSERFHCPEIVLESEGSSGSLFNENRVRNGRTESCAGLFDIPENSSAVFVYCQRRAFHPVTIFVVDCEHEQKTNTSGKVHQMRSARLQGGANQSTQRQDYEREDMYGSNWKHAG